MPVQSTGALKPKLPPKSRNSTLVAFEAEASRTAAVPDSVAPFEGIRMLVVGGPRTVNVKDWVASGDTPLPAVMPMG